jgi:hypothetical protein
VLHAVLFGHTQINTSSWKYILLEFYTKHLLARNEEWRIIDGALESLTYNLHKPSKINYIYKKLFEYFHNII